VKKQIDQQKNKLIYHPKWKFTSDVGQIILAKVNEKM